ncbi:MAG: TAT-variant-translocated molybdopterin oxidoreductase, partial [Blastocatellia bacterium]|nr:TAT-variant-translocated molybdopterin oxidoreductase [Blastocatellia bacterium]
MKRIWKHPPEKQGGRKYWRSLGELENTPEFRTWLEREFPAGAAELAGNDLTRRSFLRLMGASTALAGFGLASCRRPEAHLVPFTESVEWSIPGKSLYYASSMPRAGGSLPLIVETVDGRPIKIEGNPLHPASGGGTDAYAQASVIDLYDPDRSKEWLHNGTRSDAAAFDRYLSDLHGRAGANAGSGVAFLLDDVISPTRERLRDEILARYPAATWSVYSPLANEDENAAVSTAFGAGLRLIPRLENADVILSLDSDFLSCEFGGIEPVRAFSRGRRAASPQDRMNRLYVIEPRYTVTGGMADHRLRARASEIAKHAESLVR